MSSQPGSPTIERRLASDCIKTFGPRGRLRSIAYEAERLRREDGLSSAEVAKRLKLHLKTVQRYVTSVRAERSGE